MVRSEAPGLPLPVNKAIPYPLRPNDGGRVFRRPHPRGEVVDQSLDIARGKGANLARGIVNSRDASVIGVIGVIGRIPPGIGARNKEVTLVVEPSHPAIRNENGPKITLLIYLEAGLPPHRVDDARKLSTCSVFEAGDLAPGIGDRDNPIFLIVAVADAVAVEINGLFVEAPFVEVDLGAVLQGPGEGEVRVLPKLREIPPGGIEEYLLRIPQGVKVDPRDRVTLPKRGKLPDEEISPGIHGHGVWGKDIRLRRGHAIHGVPPASPHPAVNDPPTVYPPDAVVLEIGDIEVSLPVHGDIIGMPYLGV